MSTYVEPALWITVSALLLGSLVIVLRTPLRLLDLRTRVAELEIRLSGLDAAHKKAVRKWGMDAKAVPLAPQAAEGDDLPFPAPSPSDGREPMPPDDLVAIRRLWRQKTGR